MELYSDGNLHVAIDNRLADVPVCYVQTAIYLQHCSRSELAYMEELRTCGNISETNLQRAEARRASTQESLAKHALYARRAYELAYYPERLLAELYPGWRISQ